MSQAREAAMLFSREILTFHVKGPVSSKMGKYEEAS